MSTYYTEKDTEALKACHISPDEIRCTPDGGGTCPDCRGEVKILVATATAFKRVREAVGGPIRITSGYRCPAHQKRLFLAAVRNFGSEATARKHVAPPGGSPHNFGAALDLALPVGYDAARFARLIVDTLQGDVRWGTYPSFVHMDCAHYLNPNPDPRNFKKGVHW